MAVTNNSKNISALFALGVILLAYSAGFVYILQVINIITAVCAAVGAASLFICLLRIKKLSPKYASTGRWKKYTLFGVLIVLWSALFTMVNLIGFRHDLRWDLTAAKQHTLTENTQNLIKNLHQEIRLTAFHTGLPPKYLEDLLREYTRVSGGKIITEIIDPIVQIGYAAQFGSIISGNEKKIYIQSGKEKRELDFTEGILTEEEVTNAIVRVTRKVRRVYFLTGHNEYNIYEEGDDGLKAFDAMLGTNHVITKRLMLGIQGEIPEDCDVLVIAGPRNHLLEKDEEIIEEYLKNGGDALFLIEHTLVTTPDNPLTEEQKKLNPSLNGILNNWGINIETDVVVDLSSHASGDEGSPATRNYMTHRSIVNDLDYTFFIRPRSISIQPGRRETLKVAPIILTASEKTSWGETDRTLIVKFDEGIDRAGPVPIAFAIWEQKEEGESSDTRIIVITDADFLTNAYIGQYSNALLGINAINWLSEVDYQVLFSREDINVERLDLTSMQKRMIAVFLCLIPLLIVTAGIMVWIRLKTS